MLRAEGERVLLMCDGIIDTGCFDGKTRIYEKSELRRRVTEDIYKAAFSDAQRARIEAVQIRKAENDPASSDVCDRIFILSLSDIPRDQAQRVLKATDYAIAMGNAIRSAPAGIFAKYTEENYGDGFWWLRSCIGRSTSTDAIADYVDFYGNAGGAYQVSYKRCGIVPAIWVNI